MPINKDTTLKFQAAFFRTHFSEKQSKKLQRISKIKTFFRNYYLASVLEVLRKIAKSNGHSQYIRG